MQINSTIARSARYYMPPVAGNVNPTTGDVAALSAVQDVLDLSGDGTHRLAGAQELAPFERDQFLEMLARLLKEGVVGTERLRFQDRGYTSFATTRFADPGVAHARVFRALA